MVPPSGREIFAHREHEPRRFPLSTTYQQGAVVDQHGRVERVAYEFCAILACVTPSVGGEARWSQRAVEVGAGRGEAEGVVEESRAVSATAAH